MRWKVLYCTGSLAFLLHPFGLLLCQALLIADPGYSSEYSNYKQRKKKLVEKKSLLNRNIFLPNVLSKNSVSFHLTLLIHGID